MAADPVLRFMVQWFTKHDVPPTVRQVWKAARLVESRKTVRSAVQQAKYATCAKCKGEFKYTQLFCPKCCETL